jgi:hypothetical protein
LDVLELLNNGCVLLVDVDEGQAVVIEFAVVHVRALGIGALEVLAEFVVVAALGAGGGEEVAAVEEGLDVEAELEVLIFGLDVLGVNVEDAEDLFRNVSECLLWSRFGKIIP